MPTESPPSGQRERTSKAADAHAVTDGVNEGAADRSRSASASIPSSNRAAYAPRFAASIAPGPPPVATVTPERASVLPSRAAPAYPSVPRAIA